MDTKVDWLYWEIMFVIVFFVGLLVIFVVKENHENTERIVLESVSDLQAEIVELRKELNLHDAKLAQHNKDALYWKAD